MEGESSSVAAHAPQLSGVEDQDERSGVFGAIDRPVDAGQAVTTDAANPHGNAGVSFDENFATDIIRFRVGAMNARMKDYKAASLKHLRVQLSVEAETFHPCIELFLPSFLGKDRIYDSDDVEARFHGASQPYVLNYVNIEEVVKKEAIPWTASKWFDVLEYHQENGDEGVFERASTSELTGPRFHQLMYDEMRHMLRMLTTRRRNLSLEGCPEPASKCARRIHMLHSLGVALHRDPTPLIVCAAGCHHEILKTLLELDADVNARQSAQRHPPEDPATRDWGYVYNEGEVTALYYATRYSVGANARCGFENIETLLKAQANPNVGDSTNTTPLWFAAYMGVPRIASLLLEYQADANTKDYNGETPLHVASREGNPEIIRILVERGGDREAVDTNGKTAFDVAQNDECRNALQRL